MPDWSDLADKLAALDAVADAHGVGELVLRDAANQTWLLGARVHIPQTLDSSVLDVVVSRTNQGPELRVVTDAIEGARLRELELAGLPARWCIVPWWVSRETELPAGAAVGSDRQAPGRAGDVSVAGDLEQVHRVLTPLQRDRLRQACADATAAMGRAVALLTPTSTEYEAAGIVARELMSDALDPVVVLVAGEQQVLVNRHPLPTTMALGSRSMLACCARRHGLIASVTRQVSFGPAPRAERYLALLEVERVYLDASRAGARIGDVVAAGTAAYAAQGFDADEWHRHHQGGFGGVRPRDYLAHTGSDDVVSEHSSLAWNPSGHGWKVEDTLLVTASGPDCLDVDPSWPTVEVGGRSRPAVLVR